MNQKAKQKMNENIISLGTFNCEGKWCDNAGDSAYGELVAIDPCYSDDDEGAVFKAKEGSYNSYLIKQDEGDWGNRNAELIIVHEDFSITDVLKMEWTREGGVPVDSGQAGFQNSGIERNENRYDSVSRITLHGDEAGIYNNEGVYSSSGFGDGVYGVFTGSLEGQTVAARIHFIVQDKSILEDLLLIDDTATKDLPLLITRMKTKAGKAAFEKALKGL